MNYRPSLELLLDLNLILFRYTIIELDGKIFEYIIMQYPWWSLKDAIYRGKCIKLKEHESY